MTPRLAPAVAYLKGLLLDKVAGSPSMVRLLAFILTVDASAVVAVTCTIALRPDASALVITALGGVVTALIASGVVALFARAHPAAPPPPVASAARVPSPEE